MGHRHDQCGGLLRLPQLLSVYNYLHNLSRSSNVECASGHPYFISEVSDYCDCDYSDMLNVETNTVWSSLGGEYMSSMWVWYRWEKSYT